MQRILQPSLLLSLAGLCLTFVVIFLSGQPEASPYRFEVDLISSAPERARIYFDLGGGFSEALSAEKPVAAGANLQRCRFQIPEGTYHGLRFELIGIGTVMTLTDARIVTKNNSLIRAFSPTDFSPANGIKLLNVQRHSLQIAMAGGSPPAAADIALSTPLTLGTPSPLPSIAWRFAVLYPICLVLLVMLKPVFSPLRRRLTPWGSSFLDHCRRRPQRALAAMAAFAIAVNCYPVLFLGRSFVSPNFGTVLLYERFPTLPGYHDATIEDFHGSDVGAMIWYYVPLSMVEHRALFHDHELPLWNRYNSTGTVLLGQGQSMFGDPLHFLVIAANGAAWAWDLKFLIAKWLLAFGLGLIVFHGTRHLPSAMLTAFSASFIGFFLYRLNHPAFFSFCYAPWIFYGWCRLATASSWRESQIWCTAILLACWAEINSGTMKEAYMLLLTMNLSGLITLLSAGTARNEKLKKFLLAAWMGALFILISAPISLTFLDTLKVSYTSSANPSASQVHPVVLLGLFDEIFYRPLSDSEGVFNPAANFLVLLGVLYVIATFRRTPMNRMKVAVAISAFFPLAMAFGLVPPQWIVKVPFIANIAHIGDVFSPALIIHLIVLAGFGYQAAATRLGTPAGRGDLIIASLLLAVPLFLYLATANQVMLSLIHLPISPFVWGSLAALLAASAGLALVARRALSRGKWTAAQIIFAITCLTILLWRQGPQARIGYDRYVFHPSVRADFHATSAAVKTMQNTHGTPFRATGFEGILFPGWTGVYDLEGICGPDALMNAYYRELLEACGVDRPWEWRYAVHIGTLAQLKPVYDFLNIKYYLGLHRDENQIKPILSTANIDGTDQVYFSSSAWPRAFYTDRLTAYETQDTLGQLVRQGDGRPFAAIQTSDRAQAPILRSDLAGRTIVPATGYKLTANTTSFDVSASGPGVIVLQESWLKDDFRVEINGRPAKYLRINHAFKGVAINAAGAYHVKFAYWPHHFTLAITLCCIGIGLLLASWSIASLSISKST